MKRLLEDFAELASDWFWETDANHEFVYFSDRFTEVTGVPESQYLGRRRDQIALENMHQEKWRRHLEDLKARRAFRNFVYWTKRPDSGVELCVRISGQPIFSADGTFLGYRGVGTDITSEALTRDQLEKTNRQLEMRNRELEEAKESITRAALFDALTEIPNRRFVEKEIQDIQGLSVDGATRYIVQIDLDKFKHVNDTLGHETGDFVLKYVAKRLGEMTSEGDFLARLGGDEFVVICAENASEAHVAAFAEGIVRDFARPVELNGQVCRFGASVGYVRCSARDLRSGVRRADAALFHAKRCGRGVARCFDEKILTELTHAKRIADEIASGLEAGAFEAFFQPQLCAETFDLVGVEALARWRHPTRGIVSPGEFLPIAEEHGLIGDLDARIFECALRFCDHAAALGVDIPKCAVNVSLARLKSGQIRPALRARRASPTRIAIELVETISFDADDDLIAGQLETLRRAGFELELDDFGSGHASITSLVRISPHRLKIDKSLITPITRSEVHRCLVQSIVEIGRALSVEVIAEGVETWEHVQILRELGCGALQGFFFGRPMDGDDLLAFVKDQQWRRVLPEPENAA